MKTNRSILGILIAFDLILGSYFSIPVVYADQNLPKDIDEGADSGYCGSSEKLWSEIADLEHNAGAKTESDFAALLPEVKQLVLQSSDYVDGSAEYVDGSLVWWGGDIMKEYNPEIRAELLSSCCDTGADYFADEFNDTEKSISPSCAYPDSGVKNVCLLRPYTGTSRDVSATRGTLFSKFAEYTGGQFIEYNGTEVTVDRIAQAIESCAVVSISTHGAKKSIGITNGSGLTEEDKADGHARDVGTYYKYVNGEKTFDYDLFMIDGTVIANHMTKEAPQNLVFFDACMSMKTDALCAPLMKKGVAVIFGFSETVNSPSVTAFVTAFRDALGKRRSAGEAFSEMQRSVGKWDPVFHNYTQYQASENGAAFPVLVSEEDAYPGEGHVNVVQTAKSSWKLPVQTEISEMYVLDLNKNYDEYVIAEALDTVTGVTVTAGGVPSGMTLTYSENRVILKGTPTVKGYSVASLRITESNGYTKTKPVGIVTADRSSAVKKTKNVTYNAVPSNKWQSGTVFTTNKGYVNSADSSYIYNIPLECSSDSDLFAVERISGSLPMSLEYGFEANIKNSAYIRTKATGSTTYFTTSPGEYSVNLDIITRNGEVYRWSVVITVKPNNIYKPAVIEKTYYQYDDVYDGIPTEETETAGGVTKPKYWSGGAINEMHYIDGWLPSGLKLLNSFDYPFGLYGSPMETGDFTRKLWITTSSDRYEYTINIHVKEAAAEIKGLTKYVGDTLELSVGNIADDYEIIWQRSTDKSIWSNVSKSETYKAKAGDAKCCIRAKLHTASRDYYSDIRYINPLPELKGTIVYTSGIYTGAEITTERQGMVADIYNTDHDKVHYHWQTSADSMSGWKYTPGATESSYTPSGASAGRYIRVEVTADGYSGAIYSAPRKISKQPNSADPVTPSLYTDSPYEYITVKNAKANQEYVTAYSVGSPDWTQAKHPQYDDEIQLYCESGKTVYVYTRMREGEFTKAGDKEVYSMTYNGHISYLEGFTFDKTSITTKVGEVTALTVTTIPADFELWDNDYKVNWFVNGTGVELYADMNCSIKIPTSTAVSYKKVYVKATEQISHLNIGVQKQIGYNDIRVAYVPVEAADSDGNFALRSVVFDELILRAGESADVFYSTTPAPALVGKLSFEKNSGPDGDILFEDNGDGSVIVTVPDTIPIGEYYYSVKVDGSPTEYASYIKVKIASDECVVTLDSCNGTGVKVTETVKYASEYMLPELPEGFIIPDGHDFAGWDCGDAGESIVISEDITIKAEWNPHEHLLEKIGYKLPTCTEYGNAEYYVCDVCGKMFSDPEGYNEAPVFDYFIIPPTGHTPGTAVRENEIPATCTKDGSCDEVVYCKKCSEELSRNTTTLPAVGHSWGEPSYIWSEDNKTVTAKRICGHDSGHIEQEISEVKSVEAEDGITLTADFENPSFETQTKKISLPSSLGIFGDVDFDSSITANDALIILRASIGSQALTNEQKAAADVDGDGDITANDALAVLRSSVGIIDDNRVGKMISG